MRGRQRRQQADCREQPAHMSPFRDKVRGSSQVGRKADTIQDRRSHSYNRAIGRAGRLFRQGTHDSRDGARADASRSSRGWPANGRSARRPACVEEQWTAAVSSNMLVGMSRDGRRRANHQLRVHADRGARRRHLLRARSQAGDRPSDFKLRVRSLPTELIFVNPATPIA